MWLADSKHLIFVRQPGLPFGQQAQQGAAAESVCRPVRPPAGAQPAAAAQPRAAADAADAARQSRRCRPRSCPLRSVNNSPGLMRATFKGGYTLSFYKADVTTGEAQETWHNQPNDPLAANIGQRRTWPAISSFSKFLPGGGGRGGGGGVADPGGGSSRRRRRQPPPPQLRQPRWTNGTATTR
jgi:hypothetical protein